MLKGYFREACIFRIRLKFYSFMGLYIVAPIRTIYEKNYQISI